MNHPQHDYTTSLKKFTRLYALLMPSGILVSAVLLASWYVSWYDPTIPGIPPELTPKFGYSRSLDWFIFTSLPSSSLAYFWQRRYVRQLLSAPKVTCQFNWLRFALVFWGIHLVVCLLLLQSISTLLILLLFHLYPPPNLFWLFPYHLPIGLLLGYYLKRLRQAQLTACSEGLNPLRVSSSSQTLAPANPVGETLPQSQLGPYLLLRQLSQSPGRETFLARDPTTGQQVVIKQLSFSAHLDWDSLKLFEREVAVLRTLSHPGIPGYLDFLTFEQGNRKGLALVQTYIPAPSLQDYLDAGERFSEADIQQIITALLEILDYLHRRWPPVIHRDIKPSNILFKRTSEPCPPVYLVDFGSVDTLAFKEGKTMTVVGTYGYMAPEQFGGRATPASDLYAVGTTAIALATGKHPADLPHQNLQIQFERYVSLSPDLRSWLRRLTSPHPRSRFTSASQALLMLERPWLMTSPSAKQRLTWEDTLSLLLAISWRSMAVGGVMGSLYLLFLNGLREFWTHTPSVELCGYLIGLANGLLLGLVTRLFFYPLTCVRRYQLVAAWLGTAVGVFLGWVNFPMGAPWESQTDDSLLIYLLNPWWKALILGLAFRVTNSWIAHWYEYFNWHLSQQGDGHD